MEIDCALAVGVATPEHVALAEELGFTRAWCHEAPASYGDSGMALAVAAGRTIRIRIGLAVGGHWRRSATDAESLADLAARARGRAELVVGSPGGTGRDPAAHAAEVRTELARRHGLTGLPTWLAQPGASAYVPQPLGAPAPRGTALRTVVEVAPGADLERLVRRLRPAGLLLRPRTADVGVELAEFAETVRRMASIAA
ncbi:LLM class flavin-dependent oxidoreductase [Pseudonocardia sp. WMMC193]|uniref:LLM class flavin-dependent oxidoreductase n=1 Tax=Pseudonocardia sp. WMMC193 TaxID=2911965 RepID=UPI001F3B5DA2|nr:LLM class flavin-dependent oxidoreductase [Pseudonocardia sp. WMMC193]MCF7551427.1 LLM class flavin-dependent oxidoreductase [Pseudonocardia sp. WMMC193]